MRKFVKVTVILMAAVLMFGSAGQVSGKSKPEKMYKKFLSKNESKFVADDGNELDGIYEDYKISVVKEENIATIEKGDILSQLWNSPVVKAGQYYISMKKEGNIKIGLCCSDSADKQGKLILKCKEGNKTLGTVYYNDEKFYYDYEYVLNERLYVSINSMSINGNNKEHITTIKYKNEYENDALQNYSNYFPHIFYVKGNVLLCDILGGASSGIIIYEVDLKKKKYTRSKRLEGVARVAHEDGNEAILRFVAGDGSRGGKIVFFNAKIGKSFVISKSGWDALMHGNKIYYFEWKNESSYDKSYTRLVCCDKKGKHRKLIRNFKGASKIGFQIYEIKNGKIYYQDNQGSRKKCSIK